MSESYLFYKDVAPGAAEEAVILEEGTAHNPYSNPSLLPFENPLPPLATLEPGRWLLNGSFALPGRTVPYWSELLSDEEGLLSPAPVFDIQFSQQHSTVGLTLVFDPAAGEFCQEVQIQWYQGEQLKADQIFYPDAASYLCEKTVTSWDRLVITLRRTGLPLRRARLQQIIFGLYRRFGMTELRKVKLVNESDLSALTLPISTMDFELDSRSDIQFMFQFKQPVEAWNNDRLVGVYYIDGHSRAGLHLRSVNCYDALGVLDEIPFSGGVYQDYPAASLLGDIVGSDFALDIEVEDMALTGAILPGTKRSAMQQVLFAWGAVASTDGRYGIRVFHPEPEGEPIGLDRTYVGASVDTAAIVTEVRVTAHSYTKDANGSVEINGEKYTDTTQVFSVTNPDVTSNDKENVASVTSATLVSPAMAQAVAQRLYQFYSQRDTAKAKVVWQGERLGAATALPTPWETQVAGHIKKLNITLSNTVAADVEAIG